MTFESLHYAITERDTGMLSGICETDLRRTFSDYFDYLDDEDCQIETRGLTSESEEIQLEIIDY